MIVMMLMATRPEVMGPFVIKRRLQFLGWLVTAAMALAVATMLASRVLNFPGPDGSKLLSLT